MKYFITIAIVGALLLLILKSKVQSVTPIKKQLPNKLNGNTGTVSKSVAPKFLIEAVNKNGIVAFTVLEGVKLVISGFYNELLGDFDRTIGKVRVTATKTKMSDEICTITVTYNGEITAQKTIK